MCCSKQFAAQAYGVESFTEVTEYWIHFTVCFGGVHACGYNSAESEQIWMKSRAL